MFGPLNFEALNIAGPPEGLQCLLCESSFNLILAFDIFLKHLFEVHRLVIEDVQHIHNFPEYVKYWREKFKRTAMEEVVPSLKSKTNDEMGTVSVERYFLLSTLTSEDRELRQRLRLDHVIRTYMFERNDEGYNRNCFFCKVDFKGTRHDFLRHLSSQHNLQLGDPQNLVFVEDLVKKIDEELAALRCIYCKKTFPEWFVLKEHMRKKLHKRINYSDRDYDRFFIVRYLEGRSRRSSESDEDSVRTPNDRSDSPTQDIELNLDQEFSDWQEQEDAITCLFCDKRETNISALCLHMEADHNFDFAELTKNLDFYQKIKLVNYMRRRVHEKKCVFCDVACTESSELHSHFYRERHCKMPDIKQFDQAEFYFPTYENDALLYLIDDVED